jgi:hypothetical protein
MNTPVRKKRFFARHAKSSAMVVSLILHAILIVIAVSFVAVKVYQKETNQFRAQRAVHPQAPLKRPQVPVKIKKKRPKPKVHKRIVVKTRTNQKMPDIKMPEIRGIKGGLGSSDSAGLSGAGSLGFSMPEINLFGVKTRGEKVFIVLDSSPRIMSDEIGGIRAYRLVKEELIRILKTLPPTTLFNMAVYDRQKNHTETYLIFPEMVPASQTNLKKVEEWLMPLNRVKQKMGEDAYGVKTLGAGGIPLSNPPLLPEGKGNIRPTPPLWAPALFESMKQQADTVFLLTSDWGVWIQRYFTGKTPKWSKAAEEKWNQAYKEGLKKLAEDNKKRAERGDPPRAIDKGNPWSVNAAYFPDIEHPPTPPSHYYTPKEFVEDFVKVRRSYHKKSPTSLGLSGRKKKKMDFSINVIHFVPQDLADKKGEQHILNESTQKFKQLSSLAQGEYRTIRGEKGIQSAIKPEEAPAK